MQLAVSICRSEVHNSPYFQCSSSSTRSQKRQLCIFTSDPETVIVGPVELLISFMH